MDPRARVWGACACLARLQRPSAREDGLQRHAFLSWWCFRWMLVGREFRASHINILYHELIENDWVSALSALVRPEVCLGFVPMQLRVISGTLKWEALKRGSLLLTKLTHLKDLQWSSLRPSNYSLGISLHADHFEYFSHLILIQTLRGFTLSQFAIYRKDNGKTRRQVLGLIFCYNNKRLTQLKMTVFRFPQLRWINSSIFCQRAKQWNENCIFDGK